MLANLEIKGTNVFEKNYKHFNSNRYRYIVNQGGSRSSKTHSILQLILIYCMSNEEKRVSIVRQSFPSLRGSVMRDFFEILKGYNLYKESQHNKTEHIYKFSNESEIEFFSTDNDYKIRGRKRDVLYVNEANEIKFDIYNQLVMRTSHKVLLDFNPSDNHSYVYDILKDRKAVLIKSTYKDNPFLAKSQVDYIENLIKVDSNFYKIYALGEKPISQSRIYTHFDVCKGLPEGKVVYGLDFGFVHPSCLIKCVRKDNKIYVKEEIYESKLTCQDLIEKMVKLNIPKNVPIYSDSARPEMIEDIRRAGYKALKAKKEVKKGIDTIKSKEIFIEEESVNILKESKLYSWKSKGDKILDEPLKENDDALDALRYAIHSSEKKNSGIPLYVG